jgi:predicted nucleic acid-binding protein
LKMTHMHNIGETTLCSYADAHGGTVYMDDKPARKVAERRGLTVRGTAGLVADACCDGTWTPLSASSFMDDLRDAGLRLPFGRGGSEEWAVARGLLPPVPGHGEG